MRNSPQYGWWFLAAAVLLGCLVAADRVALRCALAVALAVVAGLTVRAARRALEQQAVLLAGYLARMPDVPEAPAACAPPLDMVAAAAHRAAEGIGIHIQRSSESRQRLEALLEGMQDAVLGLDAAGRVQWSNGHMQRLLFRDAAGSVVRQGRSLVHTVRDPELLAAVQRTLDTAEAAECRSNAVISGKIFQVNASPLPGGGAVVVLRDTTVAEEAERSQRDFVANVSHELRTPLTSIIGYVETVLDGEGVSSSAASFLQTALRNAVRMQRLTEDILLISQTEQAASPLLLQQMPVQTLLEDALRVVRGATYAEGANLAVVRCAPQEVLADSNAISQVLGNLLENAVKYSRAADSARPPTVQLFAEVLPSDPSYMTISVQDSGPGIALEHQTRIFDRFYRVEKARSRAVGGTGLGLSIARTLVEQHGGRMWAESVLGEGSTFRFTLRLAP